MSILNKKISYNTIIVIIITNAVLGIVGCIIQGIIGNVLMAVCSIIFVSLLIILLAFFISMIIKRPINFFKSSWFKENWFKFFIIIVILIIVVSWFYWNEYRPIRVRKFCAKISDTITKCELEKGKILCDNQKGFNKNVYEQCLRENGY